MPRQVGPTLMVFGSPPSTATTAALSPITPTSATSAAQAAPPARSRNNAIIRSMKPVAIFRVAPSEGPGYFDTYLKNRSIASQLVALDAGAPVPRDARRCANQAFGLGKHLGLQCHVEMTEALIGAWLSGGADEIRDHAASPGVQTPKEIEKNVAARLAALHAVADRIYDRWIEGLSRGS